MRKSGVLVVAALAMSGMMASAAFAANSVDGVWARTDGKARVQFGPCGGGTCGTVVWLQNPNGPGRIGEQVFTGMQASSPSQWAGTAHNPEDGNDYDGTMVLAGNRLTTKGCALGGMICKTYYWSRVR